jgi:exopolysaccharide biosynthesis polyprenyl glycosylphosphotransferase
VTLIAGQGEPAEAIHRRAGLFEDMHLHLVNERPLPIEDLRMADQRLTQLALGVDRIIVASTHVDPEMIGWLAANCRANQIKLSVVSPLRGRALPALRLSQVADLPVFEFNTWDPSRSTMFLKRVFDLIVSIVGLLVTAPLFPLVAVAIRLDSRGPIFFTQIRAGLKGRPFRLYKFRTMQAGAEEQLTSVVDLDQLEEPMFKLDGDPRVTRVGRMLRRLSLDELPQFVNVLLGDMSIVGPRPEQVELVERYHPEHLFRLDVKPGLTGPMQVHGRGKLTFAERLAVELDYVENLSLARDLKILARTLPAVLRGHGAY